MTDATMGDVRADIRANLAAVHPITWTLDDAQAVRDVLARITREHDRKADVIRLSVRGNAVKRQRAAGG